MWPDALRSTEGKLEYRTVVKMYTRADFLREGDIEYIKNQFYASAEMTEWEW